MRVAAQMYSYLYACKIILTMRTCTYFLYRKDTAANISAGMPFNDVSPAKKIIEAMHLAIAIILLAITSYVATDIILYAFHVLKIYILYT